MKKADIKKAMEACLPVAITDHISRDSVPAAWKATIVAVDQEQRVDDGAFRSKIALTGIRVSPAEPRDWYQNRYTQRVIRRGGHVRAKDEYEETGDLIVPSRAIYSTWNEYVTARDAARERRDEADAALNAARERCERAASVLGGVPDGRPYARVFLSIDRAEELVRLLADYRQSVQR